MKPRFLTSHYAWIQGCYWMAYCILLSFSSVYLLDQGFSNTQIGLLLGLSGLLTALLQPFVGGQGGPPKGSLPGAVRRPADPGHAAVHRRSAPASWTGRPRGTLSLPVAPASAPDLPALCPGDGLCQPGYAAELRPCPGCGGRVLRAGLHPLRQRSRRFWSKVYPCAAGRGDPPAAGGRPFLPARYPSQAGGPTPSVPAIVSPVLLAALPPVPPLLAGVVLLYTSHNILMSFPYQIVQYLGGGSGEMGTLLTLQGLMDIPAMVLFSLLSPPGCQLALGPSGRSFLFPPRPAHLAGPQCILPLWHSDL